VIDWAKIEGFDWEDGNSRKNVEKQAVGQTEAEQVFFNELLIVADERHSAKELRFHALGHAEGGRRLHITFTLRGEARLIRIISARDMHRRERTVYEKAR